jgi:hypothetical protein
MCVKTKFFLYSRCVDGCRGQGSSYSMQPLFFSSTFLSVGGSGGPLRWDQEPRIHPLRCVRLWLCVELTCETLVVESQDINVDD